MITHHRIWIVAALLTTPVLAATQTPSPPVTLKSITVGKDFTCGLDGSGQAFCWGANNQGQLGVPAESAPAQCVLPTTGRSGCALLPIAVSTPVRFTQLDAGESHVCGVAIEETVWCWGSNKDGQLGTPGDTIAPRQVALESAMRTVALGDNFSCALSADGSITCWGREGSDAVGPTTLSPLRAFVDISAGGTQLCGRAAEGQVSCWSRSDPIPAVTMRGLGLFQFTAHATSAHSCGIEASGDAYCWGPGGNGQLGGIDRLEKNEISQAQPVIGNLKFRDIAVTSRGTCGIDTERQLHCWGSVYGAPQVARCVTSSGEVPCARRPAPYMTGQKFRTISLGSDHHCGIDADGVAICWGANWAGQLGNGDTTLAKRAQVVGRSPTGSEQWSRRLRDFGALAVRYFGVAGIALLALLLFRRDRIAKRSGRRMVGTWVISLVFAIVFLVPVLMRPGTVAVDLFRPLVLQPLFIALGLTIYWLAKRNQRRPLPARRPPPRPRPATPASGAPQSKSPPGKAPPSK